MSRKTIKSACLAAAALAALAIAQPAHAACVPDNFPNGWLQAQENAGGHTIARHVGRTDAQLVQRYNNNPHIAGASTYATVNEAEGHITQALAIRRNQYNNWVGGANVGARRAYTTNLGIDVGRGIYQAARPANEGDIQVEQQVVTVMEKDGDDSCLLLTSYPTP